MNRFNPLGALVVFAVVAAACTGGGSNAPPTTAPSTAVTTGTVASTTTTAPPPAVTLRRSTTTWTTYAHELTDFGTIRLGSYDGETLVERTFETLVLENEHLVVTLVPEYGGRILSIVSKETGHESLYQNPVGVPYQIDTGVFFYDWLMVYGGIFPTFPEPEHGKTWFLPWEVEVVEESAQRISVAMSFVDDEDVPLVPRQYDGDATGLEVTYLVTLSAGRAAVDVDVTIENPTGDPVDFEYWTSATLAPGSDPDDPRVTEEAEIVAPIERIEIPSFWEAIAAQEDRAGLPDVYHFDSLRRFDAWADLGIAYAFPDMGGANFWGVIDGDTGEGIFRIADNTVTKGLKMWTWGRDSVAVDPFAGPDEARPYIELWAGLTRRFFDETTIEAGERIEFTETYAPTIGLSDVTHADGGFLVDLRVEGDEAVAEVVALRPDVEVTARLVSEGEMVHEERLSGGVSASRITAGGVSGDVRLELVDGSGEVVFEGAAPTG